MINDRNGTYLLVKLDVSGLELFLNISATEVIGELVVRERHALGSFLGFVVAHSRLRHSVERHSLVFRVSDFVEVDMGNLFVDQVGWVMRRSVTWQLGEVL